MLLGLSISIPQIPRKPAGAASGLWQPTDLGAALKEWWTAGDLANGAVGTWTGRVGGLAPTQATGANQPVKTAASFNSAYPGVTFDGSNDALVVASVGSLPVGTTGSEIIAAVSQDAGVGSGTGRALISYGDSGTAHSIRQVQRSVSTLNRLVASDGTSTLLDTVSDFTGAHIVSVRWQSAVQTMFFDGAATTPPSGGAAFTTLSARTCIGGNNTGAASFWLGVVSDIFICDALTLGQRQKLEGWIAWNRGLTANLPANHPYKAAAPTTAWDPWSLDTALKAWWSADDHGTARMVDDGAGLISGWTDRMSGIAVAGTTTARPTWAAASFNSAYAGLTFDGVANALTTGSYALLPSGANNCEIWTTVNQAALSADATTRYVISFGTWSTQTRRLYRAQVGGVGRANIYSQGVSLGDTSVNFNGNHIVGFSWDNNVLLTGRINGSPTSPVSAANAVMATAVSKLAIGSNSDAVLVGFWNGLIRHLIVTTGPLTALQRQQLEGWLAWNSGLAGNLPAGHPYKSAAP